MFLVFFREKFACFCFQAGIAIFLRIEQDGCSSWDRVHVALTISIYRPDLAQRNEVCIFAGLVWPQSGSLINICPVLSIVITPLP